MTKDDLNYCLPYFIPSLPKVNGAPYPPRTLKEINAFIQHYYIKELKRPLSIFTDVEFEETRSGVLNVKMKDLTRAGGFVKQMKRSDVISVSMEDSLWDSGVLGEHVNIYIGSASWIARLQGTSRFGGGRK